MMNFLQILKMDISNRTPVLLFLIICMNSASGNLLYLLFDICFSDICIMYNIINIIYVYIRFDINLCLNESITFSKFVTVDM